MKNLRKNVRVGVKLLYRHEYFDFYSNKLSTDEQINAICVVHIPYTARRTLATQKRTESNRHLRPADFESGMLLISLQTLPHFTRGNSNPAKILFKIKLLIG